MLMFYICCAFKTRVVFMTCIYSVFKTLQGMKIKEEKCICRDSPVTSQCWLKSVLFSSMHHEAIYNLRRKFYREWVSEWLLFNANSTYFSAISWREQFIFQMIFIVRRCWFDYFFSFSLLFLTLLSLYGSWDSPL